MAGLSTRFLRTDEYPCWDTFLATATGGNVFSASSWLCAVEQAFGRPMRIVGVFQEGTLVGGVGLNAWRLPTGGSMLAIPPLAAYSSIVFQARQSKVVRKQESHYTAVVDAVCAFVEKEYCGADLGLHHELDDVRPFQWRGWHEQTYYTYLVDLTRIDALWDHVFTDVRTKVRKHRRLNATVSSGGNADTFFRLWEETFARQGLRTPTSAARLQILFRVLEGSGRLRVYEAIEDGEVMASIPVLLDDRGVAHQWQAATAARFLAEGANAYLVWEIIEDLAAQGFQCFDLNGTGRPGFATAKNQFGGRLARTHRVWKLRLEARTTTFAWRMVNRTRLGGVIRRRLR